MQIGFALVNAYVVRIVRASTVGYIAERSYPRAILLTTDTVGRNDELHLLPRLLYRTRHNQLRRVVPHCLGALVLLLVLSSKQRFKAVDQVLLKCRSIGIRGHF